MLPGSCPWTTTFPEPPQDQHTTKSGAMVGLRKPGSGRSSGPRMVARCRACSLISVETDPSSSDTQRRSPSSRRPTNPVHSGRMGSKW